MGPVWTILYTDELIKLQRKDKRIKFVKDKETIRIYLDKGVN